MAAVKKKILEVDNHGNLEHQDSGSSDSSSSSTASTTLCCTPQYDAAFYENYPRYFSPTTSEDTELLRDYYRDIVDDSARWDVAEVNPTMEWWDEDILRSGSSSPNFDSGYDNPPSSLSSASTVASFDVPEDDHQKAEVASDQKDLKHYEVLQITDLDDHHREGQSDRLPRMILRKTEDDVQLARVEDSPEDVPNDQSWNYEYDHGSYDVFFESPYFSNTRLLMPYLKPIVLKPVAVFFGLEVVDTVDKDADKVDKSRVFDVTPEPELPRISTSISSTSTMTLAMESLALVHDPYRDYHYDGLESAARLLCGPRPELSGQDSSEVVEVYEVDVPNDVDHLDGGHDESSVLTTTIAEVKEEEEAEDIADKAVDTMDNADKAVATRVDVPKSLSTRRRTSERFRHLEKREVHLRVKKDEGVARMAESTRRKNISRNNQEENPKKEKLSREDPKDIPKKKKLPRKMNQISKSPKKNKKKKRRARDPNITPEQKRERMRTYMREYMRNRAKKMTHAQREEARERSRQNYYKRLLAENPQKFWKTLTQRINKQQK